MNILGLSAFYHDSSCCLLRDGVLVAAASEERFTRIKHDARLPTNAFRYCLQEANLIPTDLDCIAYYESPVKKSARQLAYHSFADADFHITGLNPENPIRKIREYFGFDGAIKFYDHHLSHAASAYYYSGFRDAAILTADGVGEWATTSYGTGTAGNLSLFETVDFPHSLGLLYAAITAFLGFRVNSGEYKVMGLAAYGQPTYLDQLWQLVEIKGKGQYRLNMEYFDYVRGNTMYSPKLINLLEIKPRIPETEISGTHKNLARSLQVLTEEILLQKTAYLHATTGIENLCMAGGVTLNAVANSRLRRESPFKKFFFQPAAGDAGGALGAAAIAAHDLDGKHCSPQPLTSLYLGPRYSNTDIRSILSSTGVPFSEFINQEDELIQGVVKRLLEHKIIGWFQGRMEFGPRALGARSILANPMNPDIQDRINAVIKKREAFRPFAPAVLWPHHEKFFELSHPAPYMIETCRVISPIGLPAITHVDGTARPQTVEAETNPRFAKLLKDFFDQTGCPILVNTSFNQRGEPIVCTPVDALICMGTSLMDTLVIEDFIVDRAGLPENWPEILAAWEPRQPRHNGTSSVTAEHNLYSFT